MNHRKRKSEEAQNRIYLVYRAQKKWTLWKLFQRIWRKCTIHAGVRPKKGQDPGWLWINPSRPHPCSIRPLPHAPAHEGNNHHLLINKTVLFTTQWQSLEKGIIPGSTIPTMKHPQRSCGWRKSEAQKWHPKIPNKRMDELTMTTTAHAEVKRVLTALGHMATCARMDSKPKNSSRMVIKNGKLTASSLYVQEEMILSIQEKPSKCLGKWFDEVLSGTTPIQTSRLREV